MTLQHFTLPRWFAADGEFRVEDNRSGAFDLIGFSYYATLGFRNGSIVLHPPDAAVLTDTIGPGQTPRRRRNQLSL